MKRPPRKMSALLELALKDLWDAEDDPRYTIDMNVWHQPADAQGGGAEKCSVCLAGSVMRGHCGAVPLRTLLPDDFPGWENALEALDALRCGDVVDAAFVLGLKKPPKSAWGVVRLYERDHEGFYGDIVSLIRKLKKAGL